MSYEKIIFEDSHILVVHKPSGIATQTAKLREKDLISIYKSYLDQSRSPGDCSPPYIGIVHRLDQPVEGILVLAKTKRAASSLSGQIQKGSMKKFYYALVMGVPEKEEVLEHYLVKDAGAGRAFVSEEKKQNAKKARLSYRMIKSIEGISLVEIVLHTGRFHQIRAQMEYAGFPIIGDHKYGTIKPRKDGEDSRDGEEQTALCAYRLEFNHPVSGKRLCFSIRPDNMKFYPFLPDNNKENQT